MLVYHMSDDETNVIHIITGPETDTMMTVTGPIEIDLSQAIEKAFKNSNLPLKLILSRCDSEEQTNDNIMKFGVFQRIVAAKMMGKHIQEAMESMGDIGQFFQNGNSDGNDNSNSNKPVFLKEVLCPKCHGKGVYIQAGKPPLCESCRKIEEGLKKKASEKKTPLKRKPSKGKNKPGPTSSKDKTQSDNDTI